MKQSVYFTKKRQSITRLWKRGADREKKGNKGNTDNGKSCYGDFNAYSKVNNEYFPTSILQFSNGNRNDGRIHSTQKPVSLCEYLIMTYTDVGDLVLDNCAGSCTTGVAAHKTGRKFIGFEIDKEYYEKSQRRLQQEQAQINLFDIGAL